MTEKRIPVPGYIRSVARNVLNVDPIEFGPFYDTLNAANCVIFVGEGRSQGALYIGMEQLTNTYIHAIYSLYFQGKDIMQAAPMLEKEYDKIALLVNSGSGETTTPKIVVKQLSDYIEQTGSSQFTINAVVSNKNSSIGRIGEKEYGNVVKLEGRILKSKKPITANAYYKHGIMNDVYELGSLLLFQKTREALNEGRDHTAVFGKMEKESKIITKIVRNFINQKFYKDLIDKLETRNRMTMGGLGTAKNVARMNVIRLQHAKKALGDDAYLSGPFAPRPRAGDILFLVSESGETEPLLRWCKDQKESGGFAYSIVGNESTLSRESDSFIIESTPTTFYERATFALSPLPLHLVKRLSDRGLKLPEYIMEWFQHSVTE